MELQIKTAMQMRDQGHALKQKALDLVSEAEKKVGKIHLAAALFSIVRSFYQYQGFFVHLTVIGGLCCCVS